MNDEWLREKRAEEEARILALARLKKMAARYPHMRLGQLIVNVVPEGKDLFFLTNQQFAEALRVRDKEWTTPTTP